MPTCTIIHPRLEINAIIDIHDTPKSACNRTRAKKAISRHPIYLTSSDYDYILEEIGRQEKLSLKDMYNLMAMMKKIKLSVANEYYIYISYIYILTIIRSYLFIYFLLCQFDVFEYLYV